MNKPYQVMAMVGDFPLEGQPFWSKNFWVLKQAKEAARTTRKHFLSDARVKKENFQVIVTSDDAETVNFLIDFDGQEFVDDAAHDRSDELVLGT